MATTCVGHNTRDTNQARGLGRVSPARGSAWALNSASKAVMPQPPIRWGRRAATMFGATRCFNFTCQYLAQHLSTQLFSPTLRAPSLYLGESGREQQRGARLQESSYAGAVSKKTCYLNDKGMPRRAPPSQPRRCNHQILTALLRSVRDSLTPSCGQKQHNFRLPILLSRGAARNRGP